MNHLPVRVICIFIIIAGLLTGQAGYSQCPSAGFTIQSPVCSGDSLSISNYSTGNGLTYEWNFCPYDFTQAGNIVLDSTFNFNSPTGVTVAIDQGNRVGFVIDRNFRLFRMIFGNGFDQTPTQVDDLGDLSGTLYQPTDIALYKENGNWYGITAIGGANSLGRVEFGNSLLNAPSNPVQILNGAILDPWSIDMVSDSTNHIYAVVGNRVPNTITVIDFGNSIANAPVAGTPVPIPGANILLDVAIQHECGNWYVFSTSTGSGDVFRVDFGNSLGNPATNIQSVIHTSSPSGIRMINDAGLWTMFVSNWNGNLEKYSFGTDLTGQVPALIGTSNYGGSNPRSLDLISDGDSTYIFSVYTTSANLKIIQVPRMCDANLSGSTDSVPTGIVYSTGGLHSAGLKITDASGNTSFANQSFAISDRPVVEFGFSHSCLGDFTQFLDSTTLASGSVTGYLWNFGDSDTSGLQNPVHTYSDTGNYTVTLHVFTSTGCSSAITHVVSIHTLPSAAFGVSNACSRSAIQFQDQSTIPSGLISGWSWDFGNGDTAAIQDPVYSYPNEGTYQVTLEVSSSYGCTATFSQQVDILEKPAGRMQVSNTCVGQQVQFIDLSTIGSATITGTSWDFGDGFTSTSSSTSHAYAGGPSSFPVQLIVTASNGCSDTVAQQVKINNIPTANFSITAPHACRGNDIQFNDLSFVAGDTVSGWHWDFGDGTMDTSQNPVHRFSTTGPNVVQLIAYSPTSCPSAFYQQTIQVIESPTASFQFTDRCLGTATTFQDHSIPAPGGSITSWHWDFNGLDSSQAINPTYTFPQAGLFPVVLTVVSDSGCTGTDTTIVSVHSLPHASFTYGIPCSGHAVQFTNQSTADSLSSLASFTWNFGDFGSGAANYSSLPNPSHTYDTSLVYTVFLISTTNFGCSDTTMDTVVVHPSSPASFTYSPTCLGDLMEFFNPGSPQDSAYLWNFGDQQTNQLQNPAHYYAFPGTYTVTLNVFSFGGCVTTATKQVTVSAIPVADFKSTPICLNTNYQFQDSSRISNGSIVSWNWFINNTIVLDTVPNPSYLFPDTGLYAVTLQVKSDIGCVNSRTRNVRVHPLPAANFNFNPQFGNPPLDVQFQDYSQGASLFSWDFGDGSLNSSLQAPSHTYQDTGLFRIQQLVTSIFGCRDSLSKNIYVIRPLLDIAVIGDSSYEENNFFYVVARIANLGTREIDSVKMEAQLEDGTTIQEKFHSVLPVGLSGTQWYPFRAAFQISAATGFKYYCIRALEPNGETDNVASNNERCFNKDNTFTILTPYPNPFTTDLSVRIIVPFADILTADLIDQTGKQVVSIYDGMASKGLLDLNPDLSGLSDGIYSLRVFFNDEIFVRHVIKATLPK